MVPTTAEAASLVYLENVSLNHACLALILRWYIMDFRSAVHIQGPWCGPQISTGLSTEVQFEPWSCNLLPVRRPFYPRLGIRVL